MVSYTAENTGDHVTSLSLSSRNKKSDLYIPKINGERLMATLHQTCEYGKAHPWGPDPTETGMCRLSLSNSDKLVRDWLVQELESIKNCTVTTDQMGNIFGVRAGKDKAQNPSIMMGSHLDTQPTGGRYDGILGVMSALEVLRTLDEKGIETEGGIGLVSWTNEEGARFPMITMASGVWSGHTPLETAWSCLEIPSSSSTNKPSQTFKSELTRINYLTPASVPCSHTTNPFHAHFELHIEQGPILESSHLKIGVVTGAQAYRWFTVTVTGKDSHAGTTPFAARRDAMLAAAKMIVASNNIAKSHHGLSTTGIVTVEPGSANTIARKVKFTLDIRHADDEGLDGIVKETKREMERIATEECEREGVEMEWLETTGCRAVRFDEGCVRVVEEAAEDVLHECNENCSGGGGGGSGREGEGEEKKQKKKLWMHMTSGAAHDSCHTSKRCPTAMIFTPTRNGMSHCPDEYCPPEDCILGAQVLMGAVLRYDRLRRAE